jgi:hypothetical protein
MASPNRLHHLLYKGPKILKDPGNGGIIRATADLQICEMTVSASAETRTLVRPTKPGIRLVVRLVVDGGGALVLTATGGLNVAGNTAATFSEVHDMLSLISVTVTAGTTYRWEILEGTVAVAFTTTSASKTITATDTGTLTKSASVSKTITATDTGTLTKTVSASATLTSTNAGSKTGTVTRTGTATDTTSASKTKTATDTNTATDTVSASKTKTATNTATATATA